MLFHNVFSVQMCPETVFLESNFHVMEIRLQISPKVKKPQLFKGVQCFKCLPGCFLPKGVLICGIHTPVEICEEYFKYFSNISYQKHWLQEQVQIKKALFCTSVGNFIRLRVIERQASVVYGVTLYRLLNNCLRALCSK